MSEDDCVHAVQVSPLQLEPTTSIQPVDPESNTGSSFDAPPDGGKAWIVVLGSSLALFSATGIINAYVSLVSNAIAIAIIANPCSGFFSSILYRCSAFKVIFYDYFSYWSCANMLGIRWRPHHG